MSLGEPVLPEPKIIKKKWAKLFLPIELRETFNRKIIDPVKNKRKLNEFSLILFGPPGNDKKCIC